MNPSDTCVSFVRAVSFSFSHFSFRNARAFNKSLCRSLPGERVSIFLRQWSRLVHQSPVKLLDAFSRSLKCQTVGKLIKEFVGYCTIGNEWLEFEGKERRSVGA